jgi:dTDP-4-dehydrorhamnose reductase
VRVLVTGAGGQLGVELVAAFTRAGHAVTAAAHTDLDVGDRDAVLGTITGLRPDAVVHAAAWTAVDDCESDPDRAWRVNALGCRHVADGCRRVSAHLCAVSTDYVFDGASADPYTEWDRTNPLSVYGRSKEAGEREVVTLAPGACVVRTSWLAGAGGPNFVRTMLRLAAGTGEVRVVDDQRGCPTFAADLAPAIVRLVSSRLPGVFHVTNQGATTWWGLARATFALAGADQDRVIPISTAELVPARAARRPVNAVLDNAALRLAGLPLLADHHEPLERLVRSLAPVA